MDSDKGTFWDHLDVLRMALIRSIAAVIVAATAMFIMKEFLFDTVIFGPTRDDFPTFHILRIITEWISGDEASIAVEPIKIINTRLSAQLLTHLNVAFWAGVIICVPYITAEIWHFVSPALYRNEKSSVVKALVFSGLLFYIGALTAYYLVLPLSVNFLGNYHVADDIENLIALDSYIDTLITLCISTGLAFELPVITFFLVKAGIVSYHMMKTHRKHAFLIVLIIAAMITPSTDVFTMFVTALPLHLVYELSVWVAKRGMRNEE
ncbi:MAG: twin-arginine translocase subunit TatC [Bacteroidales bacterium]|nr:twin-arginine translocase subunit TatC [Bacteroidales bacterium]